MTSNNGEDNKQIPAPEETATTGERTHFVSSVITAVSLRNNRAYDKSNASEVASKKTGV